MGWMDKEHGNNFLSASALDRLNLYKTIRHLRLLQSPVGEQLAARRAGDSLVTEVNLKQIAMLTGRNYGSIYNIYNDLLTTLRRLVGHQDADLATLFRVPVGTLRYHLVTQTAPFQFLQAVLRDTSSDLDTFAAAIGISRMTILRHMKPMRKQAEAFGVKVQPESMTVVGDERRLRIFLTMMFWQATGGAAWPFAAINERDTHRVVDAFVDAMDCPVTSPVSHEVAKYYVAVVDRRISHGHILTYEASRTVLEYPLPDLATVLAPHQISYWHLPKLSSEQQLGEIAFAFFLLNCAPLYVTPQDHGVGLILTRFKRYAPGLMTLVREFVRRFPAWGEDLRRDHGERLVQANLLAIVSSTLTLGYDFNQVMAVMLNPGLKNQPEDPAYHRLVRQTLEHVIVANHLTAYREWLDQLTGSFDWSLRQLRSAYEPPVTVKVTLLLEQTVLGYIDLVGMLTGLPMVTLVEAGTHKAVDLVIQSSELPLKEAELGTADVIKWENNIDPMAFGELYAVILTLWRAKLDAAKVDWQAVTGTSFLPPEAGGLRR